MLATLRRKKAKARAKKQRAKQRAKQGRQRTRSRAKQGKEASDGDATIKEEEEEEKGGGGGSKEVEVNTTNTTNAERLDNAQAQGDALQATMAICTQAFPLAKLVMLGKVTTALFDMGYKNLTSEGKAVLIALCVGGPNELADYMNGSTCEAGMPPFCTSLEMAAVMTTWFSKVERTAAEPAFVGDRLIKMTTCRGTTKAGEVSITVPWFLEKILANVGKVLESDALVLVYGLIMANFVLTNAMFTAQDVVCFDWTMIVPKLLHPVDTQVAPTTPTQGRASDPSGPSDCRDCHTFQLPTIMDKLVDNDLGDVGDATQKELAKCTEHVVKQVQVARHAEDFSSVFFVWGANVLADANNLFTAWHVSKLQLTLSHAIYALGACFGQGSKPACTSFQERKALTTASKQKGMTPAAKFLLMAQSYHTAKVLNGETPTMKATRRRLYADGLPEFPVDLCMNATMLASSLGLDVESMVAKMHKLHLTTAAKFMFGDEGVVTCDEKDSSLLVESDMCTAIGSLCRFKSNEFFKQVGGESKVFGSCVSMLAMLQHDVPVQIDDISSKLFLCGYSPSDEHVELVKSLAAKHFDMLNLACKFILKLHDYQATTKQASYTKVELVTNTAQLEAEQATPSYIAYMDKVASHIHNLLSEALAGGNTFSSAGTTCQIKLHRQSAAVFLFCIAALAMERPYCAQRVFESVAGMYFDDKADKAESDLAMFLTGVFHLKACRPTKSYAEGQRFFKQACNIIGWVM